MENNPIRDEKARQKIQALFDWFDNIKIPATLEIGTHLKFNDLPLAINNLKVEIKAAKLYSRNFMALYKRLEEIKNNLENGK